MSEFRITRVDTGSLEAVESTWSSLEAAEFFIREEWPNRLKTVFDLRRIVEWSEEGPLQAWAIDPADGDLVKTSLTEFRDYEPAGS